mmetsp:Transcript_19504/g.28475  ORF Transcript_19504/g.28475 Transcript_19504/m.28475 type:complete len:94 (+) Transcript_19504:183-464(+)
MLNLYDQYEYIEFFPKETPCSKKSFDNGTDSSTTVRPMVILCCTHAVIEVESLFISRPDPLEIPVDCMLPLAVASLDSIQSFWFCRKDLQCDD